MKKLFIVIILIIVSFIGYKIYSFINFHFVISDEEKRRILIRRAINDDSVFESQREIKGILRGVYNSIVAQRKSFNKMNAELEESERHKDSIGLKKRYNIKYNFFEIEQNDKGIEVLKDNEPVIKEEYKALEELHRERRELIKKHREVIK